MPVAQRKLAICRAEGFSRSVYAMQRLVCVPLMTEEPTRGTLTLAMAAALCLGVVGGGGARGMLVTGAAQQLLGPGLGAPPRHKEAKNNRRGSLLTVCVPLIRLLPPHHASMAQRTRRLTTDQEIGSSNSLEVGFSPGAPERGGRFFSLFSPFSHPLSLPMGPESPWR